MLERLHLVIRGQQLVSHRQRSVVGEQQPVVGLDELANRIRQLGRRWGLVLGDRNAPQGRDDLREHRAIQRDTGHGESRGRRWMRMHDGLDLGPKLVHRQVHQELR